MPDDRDSNVIPFPNDDQMRRLAERLTRLSNPRDDPRARERAAQTTMGIMLQLQSIPAEHRAAVFDIITRFASMPVAWMTGFLDATREFIPPSGNAS